MSEGGNIIDIKSMTYGSVPYGSAPTGGTVAELAPTCPTVPKFSGDDVTLQATPRDGIGPYYVEFRKDDVAIDPSRLGGLDNPILSAPEDIQITRVYTLNDADIAGAVGGFIKFTVFISDSCPTGGLICTEDCFVSIGCVAPVCNFIVT